ncbi:MAG: hypothetical protein IPP20_13825 [Gemmatimonadetes bacterium]|nr:hypothetical protein [Gemmatimonadota bacterium]
MHLLNIKRMGEELRPYRDPLRDRDRPDSASALSPLPSPARASAVESSTRAAAMDVSRIVDDFMATFRAGRA